MLARALGLRAEDIGDALMVCDVLDTVEFGMRRECEDVWLRLMTGRDVIIVDSFAAGADLEDENEVKASRPIKFLNACSAKTGCRPILVHHTNKGGTYRGSTAIKGALDGMWTITKKEDEEGDKEVTVKHEKTRGLEDVVYPRRLFIESADSDDGKCMRVYTEQVVFKPSKKTAEKAQALIRFLETQPNQTASRAALQRVNSTWSGETLSRIIRLFAHMIEEFPDGSGRAKTGRSVRLR